MLDRINILKRIVSWKRNVEAALARLGNQTAEEFQAQSLKVSLLDSRILGQENQIARIEGELHSRILGQETQIARHDGQIDGLAGQISVHDNQIQHQQARLAQQHVSLEDMQVLLRALDGRSDQHHAMLMTFQSLLDRHHSNLNSLAVEMQTLEQKLMDASIKQSTDFMREAGLSLKLHLSKQSRAGELLSAADHIYLSERNGAVLIVASFHSTPVFRRGPFEAVLDRIISGEIERAYVVDDPPRDGAMRLIPADDILQIFRAMPLFTKSLLSQAGQSEAAVSVNEFYDRALRKLSENPAVIDKVYSEFKEAFGNDLPPFDDAAALPALMPAEPRRRTALFLHNNYYHYNQLSPALRKRGWETLTVSLDSPDHPSRQFFHGEDLNLFDPDPDIWRKRAAEFFRTVPEKFESVHFYGRGRATFFEELRDCAPPEQHLPWDFFELRRHRVLMGYMPSGCLDGGRQSDIRQVTKGLCSACIWEKHPVVCNDAQADAWTRRIEAVSDWIGLEGDWAVGARTGAKYVRGPVVTTLDPQTWSTNLQPPRDLEIVRNKDEILVYHAVGNDSSRRRSGRDIKGTGAVLAAIKTLQEEGLPVRLAFFTNVPSTQMRFIQSQADIVIDQLRYGRYGANARECMMLGKPVIGHLDATQIDREEPDPAIEACPIVRADVNTITDVLRRLVTNPADRKAAGEASRAFMLDWHAADVCAERFERIIGRLRDGLPPDSETLFPSRKNYYEDASAETTVAIRIGHGQRTALPAHRPSKD